MPSTGATITDLMMGLPVLETPEGRRAFVGRVFWGSANDLVNSINYEGDTQTFVHHLIRRVALYEQRIEGETALWRLLDGLRVELGTGQGAVIDGLRAELPAFIASLQQSRRRERLLLGGGVVVGIALLMLGVFVAAGEGTRSAILPTATPTAPPSFADDCGLRILVTYFDAPGTITADARRFVNQVWEQVDRELRGWDERLTLRVCTLSPALTNSAAGTREEAIAAGEQWNANVVLFGSITESDGNYLIEPGYYANPSIFAEAIEMSASVRLGRDISTGIPLQDNFQTGLTLQGRASGIALVFAGLSYYLTEDYDSALETFEGIDRDWRVGRGADVVDILIGNTRLRQASLAAQRGDLDAAEMDLEGAFEAYERAQALNEGAGENYERVLIALASAQYLRWSVDRQASCSIEAGCPTGNCRSDRALLNAAMETIEATSLATEGVYDSVIEAQRDFVLLQVGYQLWRNHEDSDALRAMDAAYDRLLRRYENAPDNYWFRTLAAEAHWYRGRQYHTDGEYEDAIEEYEAALEVIERGLAGEATDLRRMFYRWSTAESLEADGQFDAALEAYEGARELALALQADYGRDLRCEIRLFEQKEQDLLPSG